MRRYAIPTLFFLLSQASPAVAGEIRQLIPPEKVAVAADDEGFAEFSGEEIQFLTLGGEPQIPSHVIRLMLPPDADPASVSVSLEDAVVEEVPGQWNVRPTPPPAFWDGTQVQVVFPEGKNIEDGRDVEVYRRNARFPATLLDAATTGEMRGVLVVEIPVATHQWNPVTRKLFRLAAAELVVSFDDGDSVNSLTTTRTQARRALDPIAKRRAQGMLRNFEEVAPAYETAAAAPAEPHSLYAIITTNEIQSLSAELSAFAESKRDRGFAVAIFTEDAWGGGTGDTAAENIRDWLQNNYVRRNIEYVLLIGNPDPASGDVPMKMLWPRNNASSYLQYKESPSDFYFADLTGDWDLDGDGFFGEWEGFDGTGGDFGTGGVDRYWEVIVGRIPFYGNIQDLDYVLAKIRSYEEGEQQAEWKRNVLLPMNPINGNTEHFLGEAIKNEIVIPQGWSFHRVYDADFGLTPPPETTPTTVASVVEAWTGEPFGAVVWAAHGSATTAQDVMTSARTADLDDQFPPFVFQMSCLNAKPEEPMNLAHSILVNAGVSTVGATRVCFAFTADESRFANSRTGPGIAYGYASRLITEEMNGGDALYDLKEDVFPNAADWWMNYTDYNLYGDPALVLFAVPDSTPALIQSNLGPEGDNLEVVVRERRRLCHYYFDNDPDPAKRGWKESECFADKGWAAPALIQSNFGQIGNFEVVTRQGDKLCHYFRDNDAPTLPWEGTVCFADNVRSAPALIQSSFEFAQQGNFEVVVQQGDQLCHYWRDNDDVTPSDQDPIILEWQEGECFGQDIRSAPALIQSNFGRGGRKNFELVVRQGDQLCHYYRDGSLRWKPGACFGENVTSAPALIQSNLPVGGRGNFEVVVRHGDELCHWWRDNDDLTGAPFLAWNQGECFGQDIESAPSLIQSSFGEIGDFEVAVQQAGRVCHWMRDNDGSLAWTMLECIE